MGRRESCMKCSDVFDGINSRNRNGCVATAGQANAETQSSDENQAGVDSSRKGGYGLAHEGADLRSVSGSRRRLCRRVPDGADRDAGG